MGLEYEDVHVNLLAIDVALHILDGIAYDRILFLGVLRFAQNDSLSKCAFW
jgi:hypothetical protein